MVLVVDYKGVFGKSLVDKVKEVMEAAQLAVFILLVVQVVDNYVTYQVIATCRFVIVITQVVVKTVAVYINATNVWTDGQILGGTGGAVNR